MADQIILNADIRERTGSNKARVIRNIDGKFLVLEDNLRVPSGVSYMLENRMVMGEVFPELFTRYRVSPINHYCNRLYHCMLDAIPYKKNNPTIKAIM